MKEGLFIKKVDVIIDADENKLVIINDIRFKGKRKIDWENVKLYLQEYIGAFYEIAESSEIIYIGNEFPEEFTESESKARKKG